LNLDGSGCAGCISRPFLFEGRCVDECPVGYYSNRSDCVACKPGCAACDLGCPGCDSENFCTKCSFSYNFYNNSCFTQCPDETYSGDGICLKCSKPCFTCFGSGHSQCIVCNEKEGYIRDAAKRICTLFTCVEGTTFELNDNKPTCVPCHESCATCKGKNYTDCTSCRKGLSSLPGLKEGEILCEVCENKMGYETDPDGSCIGIIYRHN